jgi:hypothetical protein
MKFLEKDLEEIIYTSGRDVLDERGLTIEGKLLRQVKIGNYGIADLIEFTRPYYDGPEPKWLVPGRIKIYELKKEQVGIAGFLQALSYAKGVLEYLRLKGKSDQYIIDICLIGKTVDTSGSFCYIESMLKVENDYHSNCIEEKGLIEFYTYSFDINGLEFKHKYEYSLKDNGFKI